MKIPPDLPLEKGGIIPLFGKVGTTRNREGRGEIKRNLSARKEQ
jgi:hypothetical protein